MAYSALLVADMNFISLFSGIGGFDLALSRLGMHCVAQVEIDKNCQAVLQRHWPDVPRWSDVRDFGRESLDGTVKFVVGGFPCVDVSTAGKRRGLAGSESGLWFEFHRVLAEFRPKWVLIENVAGLLSSNGGRDMGTVLCGLADIGYGWAYRVLDSKYFGVPQRRRRVYIVGCAGGAVARAAQVLFESESVRGNPSPRGQEEQEVAGPLGSCTGGTRQDLDGSGAYIVDKPEAFDWSVAGSDRTYIMRKGDYAQLRANGQDAIAYHVYGGNKRKDRPQGGFYVNKEDFARTLDANGLSPEMSQGGMLIRESRFNAIRRLLPIECLRLQGFEDDWMKGQSDTAIYRATGNAVTVNVITWIGKRLLEADRET